MRWGKYNEAVHWFDEKLQLDPDDVYAMVGYGFSQIRLGKRIEGKIWLEEAMQEMEQLKREKSKDYQRRKQEVEQLRREQEQVIQDLEAQTVYERAENEKKEKELTLSRQLSAAGMVASQFSHEIKQPLQVILMTSQACQNSIHRNKATTASIIKDLEAIIEKTKKLNEIINHLRAFSRLDKSEMKPVDVNEVVKNCATIFGEQLKYYGVQWATALTEPLPPIEAHEIQLELVLVNLVTNAREAMSEMTEQDKRVKITTWAKNGHVGLEIEDNGPGIPAETLPHIFDLFFTTKEYGSGLGLYTSKRFIENFGGRIEVSSVAGVGTTFYVEFPVLKNQEEKN